MRLMDMLELYAFRARNKTRDMLGVTFYFYFSECQYCIPQTLLTTESLSSSILNVCHWWEIGQLVNAHPRNSVIAASTERSRLRLTNHLETPLIISRVHSRVGHSGLWDSVNLHSNKFLAQRNFAHSCLRSWTTSRCRTSQRQNPKKMGRHFPKRNRKCWISTIKSRSWNLNSRSPRLEYGSPVSQKFLVA